MPLQTRASRLPYFDNDGRPIALAHRGGALTGDSVGLENSMVAFRSAVELGYRYVETDVHATSDGELLAFHDDTLDRTTDRSGAIADMPYSEAARARIDGREPIPRFADVLEEFPEVRFNVDLKTDGSVDPMVDLIRRTGSFDRICLASFSSRRLARARRALGEAAAFSVSPVGAGVLRLAPTRLAARVPEVAESAASQVPVRQGRIEVVTPSFIARNHALGMQVHVWTIDDPAEIRRLLDLGVDGIVSDRIDNLRSVLIERGQW